MFRLFVAPPQVATDPGVIKMHDWSWQQTGNDHIRAVPSGIRKLLQWMQGTSTFLYF